MGSLSNNDGDGGGNIRTGGFRKSQKAHVIYNGNFPQFVCLVLNASLVLQHGGFVPRE